jgi:hypothetical protein
LIFFSFIAIQIAFFIFKSALGQALVEALRPTMRHSWLPFWGAIATAIGYGGGAWRGAYVCARAESLQRRMEKDLEFILEWLWNNFGDDAKR